MNLKDFFLELDNLFAQKNIAAVDNYLAQHLEEATNLNDEGYKLAVLNEQVGYYRSLGHFTQSLAAGEQAMAIISTPDYAKTVSAATTMLNVATAFRAAKRNNEALELYNKVAEIYSTSLPPNDARLAALYNNMAQALMASDDKKNALKYLLKALEIVKLSGINLAEVATTHSNIALLYMTLDDKKEALEHLNLAMAAFESLDYDDAHYPAAISAMAHLMYSKGAYTDAVEQYQLALTKTEMVFGQNVDYARICRNCAQAYSKAEMPAKADEFIKKAEAIEAKLQAKNSHAPRSNS